MTIEAPQRDALGIRSHALDPHAALTQYAFVGVLSREWYEHADTTKLPPLTRNPLTARVLHDEHDPLEQALRALLVVARHAEPAFLARLAVASRHQGFRKDLPAFLCAVLAARGRKYLEEIFPVALDNAKMLRRFVGYLRSGIVGRRSLGSWPRRLVRQWLETRSDEELFRSNIGSRPSLAEVIHLAHPKPATDARRALYGYMLKKPHVFDELPLLVRQFEAFRQTRGELEPPAVPFLMLSDLTLTPHAWCRIVENMGWHALRSNLAALQRHGVFQRRRPPPRKEDGLIAAAPKRSRQRMTEYVAERLTDRAELRSAMVLPSQVLTTWSKVRETVPGVIANALLETLERSLENVPVLSKRVCLCLDVSQGRGRSFSVDAPLGWSTSSWEESCLFVAALMRSSPQATLLAYSDLVHSIKLRRRASAIEYLQALSGLPCGYSNAGYPIEQLNERGTRADLVVLLAGEPSTFREHEFLPYTRLQAAWKTFRERNPKAHLVCVHASVTDRVAAPEGDGIINVSGIQTGLYTLLQELSHGVQLDRWTDWVEHFAAARVALHNEDEEE